jgi:hypothetical protein
MQEILPILQKRVKNEDSFSFSVLNPDTTSGYAGTTIEIDNQNYIYRGWKAWVDLAELLQCKMLIPKEKIYPLVELTFQKLEKKSSFHLNLQEDKKEKYGTNSQFFEIHKMEEPAFFYYYNQALSNVNIQSKKHILNLGINRGDEFEVIKSRLDENKYNNMQLVGIDHSKTAIEYAQNIFKEKNVKLYTQDINNLHTLNLGKFDLLISIGTLQSPSINFKLFFMNLVQNYLKKDSAIILGFPNSRWVGGEVLYGAKAPNYAMSEMSLLFSDVMFCKKYLQQKKFRVTITGKQYIFLTATKIGV